MEAKPSLSFAAGTLLFLAVPHLTNLLGKKIKPELFKDSPQYTFPMTS
jgi:hypothetical protein